jgi:hypothetical protein
MSLTIRPARPGEAGLVSCKSLGAVLMADWAVCPVVGPALTARAGEAR